jgi:hypothetical protein
MGDLGHEVAICVRERLRMTDVVADCIVLTEMKQKIGRAYDEPWVALVKRYGSG